MKTITLGMNVMLSAATVALADQCHNICADVKKNADMKSGCSAFRNSLPRPKVSSKCQSGYKAAIDLNCYDACTSGGYLQPFHTERRLDGVCNVALNETPRPLCHDACVKGYRSGVKDMTTLLVKRMAKAAPTVMSGPKGDAAARRKAGQRARIAATSDSRVVKKTSKPIAPAKAEVAQPSQRADSGSSESEITPSAKGTMPVESRAALPQEPEDFEGVADMTGKDEAENDEYTPIGKADKIVNEHNAMGETEGIGSQDHAATGEVQAIDDEDNTNDGIAGLEDEDHEAAGEIIGTEIQENAASEMIKQDIDEADEKGGHYQVDISTWVEGMRSKENEDKAAAQVVGNDKVETTTIEIAGIENADPMAARVVEEIGSEDAATSEIGIGETVGADLDGDIQEDHTEPGEKGGHNQEDIAMRGINEGKMLLSLPITVDDKQKELMIFEGDEPMDVVLEFCRDNLPGVAACVDDIISVMEDGIYPTFARVG